MAYSNVGHSFEIDHSLHLIDIQVGLMAPNIGCSQLASGSELSIASGSRREDMDTFNKVIINDIAIGNGPMAVQDGSHVLMWYICGVLETMQVIQNNTIANGTPVEFFHLFDGCFCALTTYFLSDGP